MRRSWFLLSAILICLTLSPSASYARNIALVYDDSASMAGGDSTKWLHANYALQTLCALLDEGDAIAPLYMSAYYQRGTSAERIKNDALSNAVTRQNIYSQINKIKNQREPADTGTPYPMVNFAIDVLAEMKSKTNTKARNDNEQDWLIVITDGAFEEGQYKRFLPRSLKHFANIHNGNTRVAFLFIGSQVDRDVWREWNSAFPALVEPAFIARNSSEVPARMEEIAATIAGRDPQSNIRVVQNKKALSFESKFPLHSVTLLQQRSDGKAMPTVLALSPSGEKILSVDVEKGKQSGTVTHFSGQGGNVIPAQKINIALDGSSQSHNNLRTKVLLNTAVDFSVYATTENPNNLQQNKKGHYTTYTDEKYRVVAHLHFGSNAGLTDKQRKAIKVYLIDQNGNRTPMSAPDKSGRCYSKILSSSKAGTRIYSVNAKAPQYFNLKSNIITIHFAEGTHDIAITPVSGGMSVPYKFVSAPEYIEKSETETGVVTYELSTKKHNIPSILSFKTIPQGIALECNGNPVTADNATLVFKKIPKKLTIRIARDKNFRSKFSVIVPFTIKPTDANQSIEFKDANKSICAPELIIHPKKRSVSLGNEKPVFESSVTQIDNIPAQELTVWADGQPVSKDEIREWEFAAVGNNDIILQGQNVNSDTGAFEIKPFIDCFPCFADAGNRTIEVTATGPFYGDELLTEVTFNIVDAPWYHRCKREIIALLCFLAGLWYLWRLLHKKRFPANSRFVMTTTKNYRTREIGMEWLTEHSLTAKMARLLWPSTAQKAEIGNFTCVATGGRTSIFIKPPQGLPDDFFVSGQLPDEDEELVRLESGEDIEIRYKTTTDNYTFYIEDQEYN